MSEKITLSVSEAAEILKNEGILTGKFSDQAVRRLITEKRDKEGNIIRHAELKASPPPANQPKLGYRIEKDSLDRYIKIGKMSVSELRKALMAAMDRIDELEQKREG